MKTKQTNKYLITIIAVLVLSLSSVAMTEYVKVSTNAKYGVILDSLKKGDIAEESIYVDYSVDIVDEEATLKAREEAYKAVLPVFSFNSISTIKSLSSFETFRGFLENKQYGEVRKFISEGTLNYLLDKQTFEIVGLAYDLMKQFLIEGYFEYDEILELKNNGYSQISIINNYLDQVPLSGETVISIDNLITTNNLTNKIQENLRNLDLTSEDLYVIESLIYKFSSPNALYDDYLTEIRRKDAYDNCSSVIVSLKKGDAVISANHVIKEENLYTLKLLSSSTKLTMHSITSDLVFEVILLLGTILLIFYYLKTTDIKLKTALVTFDFAVLSCLFMAVCSYYSAKYNFKVVISIYPVLFVPILTVMLTGSKKLGYIYSLLITLMMVRLPGIGVCELGYLMLISFVCCLPFRFLNKRLDMILQWFISWLGGLVAPLFYILVSKKSIDAYLEQAIAYTANLTLSYILLAIIVPVLEKIMNLPTSYRLHELAYSDSPALTRLSQIAPGTYTHSCAVADLAEAAAKAVGANALLCRVGALYHDIGKTEHPEYFVENQNGENKHDDINPSLSATIIKNHIKIGAQKGKELGLPDEIIQMIEGHHGNDVISYFYNEALKEGKQGSTSESDYTYDSDTPVTKETGILMLADSVEAASRTVTPNPQKYTKLIENIFLGKIERHQLSKCKLSFAELNKIKIVFINTLLAKNHSRIEYPDQEED